MNEIDPNTQTGLTTSSDAHFTGDKSTEGTASRSKGAEILKALPTNVRYVPISLFPEAKQWYQHIFRSRRRILEDFQKGEHDTYDHPLKEEVNEVFHKACDIMTHPDLIEDERVSRALVYDPDHRKERNQASSKFTFIVELLDLMVHAGTEKFVLIVFTKPGRVMDMLEAYLRNSFVPYFRPDTKSSNTYKPPSYKGFEVVMLPAGDKQFVQFESSTLGQPDLIVGLDESFNMSDPLVERLTRQTTLPVVQLLAPHGADHISCILSSLELSQREFLYSAVKCSLEDYQLVGNSNDDIGPKDIAKKIADAIKSQDPSDWEQVPRLEIDPLITRAPLQQQESIEERSGPSQSRKRRREMVNEKEEEAQRPSPFDPASALLNKERAGLDPAAGNPETRPEFAGGRQHAAEANGLLVQELMYEVECLKYRARMLEAEIRKKKADEAANQASWDLIGLKSDKSLVEARSRETKANAAENNANTLLTKAKKIEGKKLESSQTTHRSTASRAETPSSGAADSAHPNPNPTSSTIEIDAGELMSLRAKSYQVDTFENEKKKMEAQAQYLKDEYQTAHEQIRVRDEQVSRLEGSVEYYKEQASGEISRAKSMSLDAMKQEYEALLAQVEQELESEKRRSAALERALEAEKRREN